MSLYKIVVANYDVCPPTSRNTTQGGHFQNPSDPLRTLCGKLVVEKKSTIQHCLCTGCYLVAVDGKVPVRKRHTGTPAKSA